MNDRELLEQAARAAGIDVPKKNNPWKRLDENGLHQDISGAGDGTKWNTWNPLTNNGDALWLAVKLGLLVDCFTCRARKMPDPSDWITELSDDDYQNTRRAIVRAAAEIGKSMA